MISLLISIEPRYSILTYVSFYEHISTNTCQKRNNLHNAPPPVKNKIENVFNETGFFVSTLLL